MLLLLARPLSLVTAFPRVDVKHHGDDGHEDEFEQGEVAEVEAARFVERVLIDDERGDGDGGREPDDLSFGVPHKALSLSGFVA